MLILALSSTFNIVSEKKKVIHAQVFGDVFFFDFFFILPAVWHSPMHLLVELLLACSDNYNKIIRHNFFKGGS